MESCPRRSFGSLDKAKKLFPYLSLSLSLSGTHLREEKVCLSGTGDGGGRPRILGQFFAIPKYAHMFWNLPEEEVRCAANFFTVPHEAGKPERRT